MKLTLRQKIVVLIIGIVIVLGGISTYSVFSLANEDSKHDAEMFYERFQNSLNADEKALSVALTSITNRSDLKETFISQDRAKLLEISQGYFSELKTKYNITHMYFLNPDGTVFLRVHKPESSGDKVERYTFKGAVQQQKIVSGLETGATAFAFRVVSPVTVNGKVVGYFEVGEEIDKVLEDFKKSTGADITFVMNDKFVDKSGFKEDRIYNNSVIYASTEPTMIKDLLTAGKYDADLTKEAFRPLLKKHQQNHFYLTKKFADASDQTVGHIVITGNADNFATTMNMISTAVLIVLIITILLAWFISRSLSKPISVLSGLMAEAEKGDLTVKGTSASRDEFGKLIASFNQMLMQQSHMVGRILGASDELAASSQQMVASSEEITASAAETSTNIEVVAKNTEEGSKAINEAYSALLDLSSVIESAKARAEHAAESTVSTLQTASAGKSTVAETITRMQNINSKTHDTENLISTLNEYSQQIDQISATITGIAGQTNLLALNAAIEAARAGDAGKGFAVVADEVRKLAEQSNREAGEVASLVNKITEITAAAVKSTQQSRTEVQAGVSAVNEAGAALENIVSAANYTVSDVKGIVEIANQTVATSQKIIQLINSVAAILQSTAVNANDVAYVTRETTAAMQTVAASSQQFSAMAVELKRTVEQFKID